MTTTEYELGIEPPVREFDDGVDERTWDLVLDWPIDDESLRPWLNLEPGSTYPARPYDARVTAAGLNDDFELTFAEIADLVDYFGIKEIEEQ